MMFLEDKNTAKHLPNYSCVSNPHQVRYGEIKFEWTKGNDNDNNKCLILIPREIRPNARITHTDTLHQLLVPLFVFYISMLNMHLISFVVVLLVFYYLVIPLYAVFSYSMYCASIDLYVWCKCFWEFLCFFRKMFSTNHQCCECLSLIFSSIYLYCSLSSFNGLPTIPLGH